MDIYLQPTICKTGDPKFSILPEFGISAPKNAKKSYWNAVVISDVQQSTI